MVATEQRSLSRSELLRTLFQGLDDHGIRYCVLHSYELLPDKLSSDLDLALHPNDFPKLPLVIRTLRQEGYIPVQCLNYGVKGYCFVFFWFEGMTFKSLAVDTICQYREGGLILMSGAELVTGRRKLGEFWVPRPEMEFAYLLASKTLKRRVSARQAKRLQHLVAELGRPQAECVTASLSGESSKERVVDACAAGIGPGVLKELRSYIWRTMLSRDPLNPVRYRLSDLARCIRRWFQPTGLFLVVLGPDGVGKSTLIQGLISQTQGAFRTHRLFHWRPMLLWRRRKSSSVTAPHARPEHSASWSVAQMLAYLLDYWLGYWLKVRPPLARSGLVIFDRYFEDALSDPARYRYGGPLWLVQALRPLIPKPDLVLVLDAPEAVVVSRKQEVPPEEIRRQRQIYRKLAAEFSPGCVLDAEQPAAQVSRDAATVATEHLASRFRRRHAAGLAWHE